MRKDALTPDPSPKKGRGEAARDETQSLTEEIQRVEREIDERVKGLYGL